MAASPNPSFSHLRIDRFFEAKDYKPRSPRIISLRPQRDSKAHGAGLVGEWIPIRQQYEANAKQVEALDYIKAKGLVIELELAAGARIEPSSFEKEKYGLQLLIRRVENRPVEITDDKTGKTKIKTMRFERQTWFIPDGQIQQFEELLRTYAGELDGSAARAVVDCIDKIGPAAFEQLWTDSVPVPEPAVEVWLEFWLRAPEGARSEVQKQFELEVQRLGMRVGVERINFPDYTILMVRGRRELVESSTALLACVAEIRSGRDFAEFIESLPVDQQAEFGKELLGRTSHPTTGPRICIMDTGVNRGHPLIEPALAEQDSHTIKTDWGRADDDGHGTPMAGLALFFDVGQAIASTGAVQIPALLESTKIIPPNQDTGTEKHAAAFTQQGVYLTEAASGAKPRVWCLATTWTGPNDGKPSSWSAVIDRLAAGLSLEEEQRTNRRLFVLAAGNVDQNQWQSYPDANFNTACHIPTQAWNALVVGAYTNKREPLTSPGSGREIAPLGALAPCSSTTVPWGDAQWPYRPDIVLEGGNARRTGSVGAPEIPPELQPLSLCADFRTSWFTCFGATSAASPAAAYMAAQLMKDYPDYWPETIRGLIVHSAKWTNAMELAAPDDGTERAKAKALLRTVGYGVPALDTARASVANRVTLVAQNELQPFQLVDDVVKPHQMNVYSLPWPKQQLATLGEQIFGGDQIRLRVTLSYFIDPNPGERGYSSSYRYAGCQLRFRVNQPGQTLDELIETVSAESGQADEEGEDEENGKKGKVDGSKGWKIGSNGRTRGSIHSDWWEGSASELREMSHVIVYPMTGWWRSRPKAGQVEAKIRYALIVTLESADSTVDIYTEIANQIAVPVAL